MVAVMQEKEPEDSLEKKKYPQHHTLMLSG